jgi:hypothetical protein
MNLQGRSFTIFSWLNDDNFTDYVDVNLHLTIKIKQLNGLNLNMWNELEASLVTRSTLGAYFALQTKPIGLSK